MELQSVTYVWQMEDGIQYGCSELKIAIFQLRHNLERGCLGFMVQ